MAINILSYCLLILAVYKYFLTPESSASFFYVLQTYFHPNYIQGVSETLGQTSILSFFNIKAKKQVNINL